MLPRRALRLLSVLIVLSGVLVPVGAQDSVSIGPPTLYPDSPAARQRIDELLGRAAREASELFEQELSVRYSGGRSGSGWTPRRATPGGAASGTDYTLEVFGAYNPGSPRESTLTLTLRRDRDGTTAQATSLFGAWEESRSREIAHLIRHAHRSLVGFDYASPADAPRYLDEFTGTMISTADLGYAAPVTPTSVAVGPNGNLFVGASVAAIELDPLYREVGKPGRELFSTDRIPYAYSVDVTAAGTIFARTAADGRLFVIRPDFDRHQRLRTGVDVPAASVSLSDGSYVVFDSSGRRAVRIHEGRSAPLDIFAHENAYMFIAAAGPEATLWTWDFISGTIHVFTADGVRVDTVAPLIPFEERGTVKAIRTLPGGDFLLLTMRALYRFDRLGTPVWRLDGMPPPLSGEFTMVHDMAVDAARGYIYLVNSAAQTVVRLIDRSMATSVSSLDEQVLALNARIAADSHDRVAYEQLAELYERAGAPGLAVANRQAVVDVDPFDFAAGDALDRAEGLLLSMHARRGAGRAIEVLETVGAESARATYSVTVQLYEQAQSRLTAFPDERRAVLSELDGFRRTFNEFESPGTQPRPPRMEVAGLTDLFPALIQHYLNNPVGTVHLTNNLDEPLYDLSVATSLRYQDFPVVSDPVSELAPGAHVEVPVRVVLSSDVLELQEDTPVLVGLELRYSRAGAQEHLEVSRSVTMRRNTALLWDDSGKLSSFITPNDEVIQDFALAAVVSGAEPPDDLLSPTASRAARIADAVGAYGIRYVEDPNSPFTEVFERSDVLDTVRFPRNTLRVRSGDCDDTASLLASLYEAVGIRTAIMTSPGHVFIAFDTAEPAGNRWLYEAAGREVIVHNGTVWLPVETTILGEGFDAAWEEGSRLVRTYPERIEFLPLSEQRALYPAIPLRPASFEIVAPEPAAVDAIHDESRRGLADVLYSGRRSELAAQIDTAEGRAAVRLTNRIGVLNARNRDLHSAERSFQDALELESTYIPALVNLANVFHLRGDHAEALETVSRALDVRPRSPSAQALFVQVAVALEQTDRAAEMWSRLLETDPSTAERLSGLFGAGTLSAQGFDSAAGGERASAATAQPVLIWEEE